VAGLTPGISVGPGPLSNVVGLTEGRHILNEDLVVAKEVLIRSGMLITPSDGCFALTVDARDGSAVERLRIALDKPDAAISVAFANLNMLAQYTDLHTPAARLAHHLMPGPLTLVAPITAEGKRRLGDNLNQRGTIGGRLPESPVERQLSEAILGPITTTAIRDDRGDLVTDPHDARAVVEEGLQRIDDLRYPPLFSLMMKDEFRYQAHSTVAEIEGDGKVVQVREGVIPWKDVLNARGRMSRAEIEDWT
jgi:tRNA A37 threonylcarbamoyladenosine synthetase subunit TsaC/SUA5/YrdC